MRFLGGNLTRYNSSRLQDTGCFECTACTAALSFTHVRSSKSGGSCGLAAPAGGACQPYSYGQEESATLLHPSQQTCAARSQKQHDCHRQAGVLRLHTRRRSAGQLPTLAAVAGQPATVTPTRLMRVSQRETLTLQRLDDKLSGGGASGLRHPHGCACATLGGVPPRRSSSVARIRVASARRRGVSAVVRLLCHLPNTDVHVPQAHT